MIEKRALEPRGPAVALVAVSAVLLGLRIHAASVVGFGDSEALYATYAAHPQAAYLDHPGLVGMAMRAIGPTPPRVHLVTAVAATIVPALVFFVARALGAMQRPAILAAIAVALAPEMAVGLFGMTPDLLLAPLWIGSIGLAAVGLGVEDETDRELEARRQMAQETNEHGRAHAKADAKWNARSKPNSIAHSQGRLSPAARAAAFVGAGLFAGVACSAKVSGLLLLGALAVVYAKHARRSVWSWAGLLCGMIVLVPIVQFEARTGWPMIRHRFVDTQHGAGIALRNLGALAGGQLLYLSPGIAVLLFFVARDLWRQRNADATSYLFFMTVAVPFVPLVLFSLWSPVAEPHWIAPAFLALPLHAARTPGLVGRRIYGAAVALAGLVTAAAHAYVLVPESARLVPGDPKVDIASELYGWPMAIKAIENQRHQLATPFDPLANDVVIVGPHWTICAQLAASMPHAKVGCATPVADDFDGWLPRAEWRKADRVIFVTDNRYSTDGADQLPGHARVGQSRVRVYRGGKPSRVFEIYLYDSRGAG